MKTSFIVLALIAGFCTGFFSSYITLGRQQEHFGVVESTTKDSWIIPTTTITIRTLGGSEKTLKVYGYEDFDVGCKYKITTVVENHFPFAMETIVEMKKLD